MLLPRLSWIARMEPRLEGPPTAKMAFTRVLSELSVYAPGRCALPTTNTWIERSWPMVTSSSKLRKLRDTAVRTCAVRSLNCTPATGIEPTRGMLIMPLRSTRAR